METKKTTKIGGVKAFVLASLVGVSLLFGGVQSASAAKLSDLIANNGFIIDGDKKFSNFQYLDNIGLGPGAASIAVNGDTQAGLHGLEFTGAFFAFPGQVKEIVIGYTATVLDPTKLISDIHLAFNGAVVGTGLTFIEEYVYDENLNPLINNPLTVSNPPQLLSAQADFFYAVPTAIIQKVVHLEGGRRGAATISFFDQWFSQTTVVPEPASVLLIGMGAVGLGFLRRKAGK